MGACPPSKEHTGGHWDCNLCTRDKKTDEILPGSSGRYSAGNTTNVAEQLKKHGIYKPEHASVSDSKVQGRPYSETELAEAARAVATGLAIDRLPAYTSE